MNVPAEAKVTKENGCLDIKIGRIILSFYPSHREELHSHIGKMRELAKPTSRRDGHEITLSDVQFGAVSGLKSASRWSSPRSKRIEYSLTVPGGYIVAILQNTIGDFDEARFESWFDSIHVVNYAPDPLPPRPQNTT